MLIKYILILLKIIVSVHQLSLLSIRSLSFFFFKGQSTVVQTGQGIISLWPKIKLEVGVHAWYGCATRLFGFQLFLSHSFSFLSMSYQPHSRDGCSNTIHIGNIFCRSKGKRLKIHIFFPLRKYSRSFKGFCLLFFTRIQSHRHTQIPGMLGRVRRE